MLLVVGDGPASADLVAKARGLGIDGRLRITGRVPHDAIPEHVAAMDVAVSPRATFYASPMKIPEYMAGARAVIAPRMPNIEDLVDDGRTGLLFEPEVAESLAARLFAVLRDADRRRALGFAARSEVENRLNWRASARRIARLAEEVAAERRPSSVAEVALER
jgi:glycosyltransferase involved in cell wall biosynthesis